MNTCKYCGTELKEKDSLYHCSYCDLSFEIQETCLDRKRMKPIPELYDFNYYKSTKDLLEENTVVLFHMLSECRKDWYTNFSLLSQLKNAEPSEDKEEEESNKILYKQLYNEYIQLTKQKFIIENILLEKAGYVPEKITKEFLGSLVEQSKAFAEKPMYIYIKSL